MEITFSASYLLIPSKTQKWLCVVLSLQTEEVHPEERVTVGPWPVVISDSVLKPRYGHQYLLFVLRGCWRLGSKYEVLVSCPEFVQEG